MKAFWAYKIHIALFVVFLIANTAFLTSIPGLMGDEADEGEHAFHMLDEKKIAVLGERSYIGPMIDYIRVPFVLAFGYTPLALRAVTLVASIAFFCISAILLARYLGIYESIIPLALLTLSPIYLTQQRIGWAITLLPLFAVLLVYALTSSWKHKYLLAGLIAGLGLANHLLFLATLVPIVVIAIVMNVRHPKTLLVAWPALIGFMAGFSMQFAILQLYPDDQGSQKVIAETLSDRWQAFSSLVPEVVSGSSYIASYTGRELSPVLMNTITGVLGILALVALTISKHRKVAWVIGIALGIHLAVLLRIIDRFNLRYSTVFVFLVWILAGIGIEWFMGMIRKRHVAAAHVLSFAIAITLVLWAIFAIVVPYVHTGGSTKLFSLGNRTDSSSSLVDTRPLFACVNNLGPLYSENVHIYNRILFWSRQYPGITVLDEDHKNQAKYLIDYRIERDAKRGGSGVVCPELVHFRITPRT